MTTATPSADGQTLFDVAVVMTTVLRPTLVRAVRSVFAQDFKGRIQILIGIDRREGDGDGLDMLARDCPAHVRLTILDLGYSTSRRHGGLYPSAYGGALRTILSYAANSRLVAYLDDDDWWAKDHLAGLVAAIAGKAWAFSYRWLVDRETGWPVCRDEWDSVGPGRGINQKRFGGFVSPSTLMLDKEGCHFDLPYWSLSAFSDGTGEDRAVFQELLKHGNWAASGTYSCYYEVSRTTLRERHHARELAERRLNWIGNRGQIEMISRLAGEAAAALARGIVDEAIAACRRALALHPCHPGALHCLALAERRAGDRAAALAHITEAAAADALDPAIAATWAEMTAGGVAAGELADDRSHAEASL
jgi:hypothetical protein